MAGGQRGWNGQYEDEAPLLGRISWTFTAFLSRGGCQARTSTVTKNRRGRSPQQVDPGRRFSPREKPVLAPATDRVKSLIENDLGPAQLRQVKWKLQRCREKRAV